jgi:hypothetical protein
VINAVHRFPQSKMRSGHTSALEQKILSPSSRPRKKASRHWESTTPIGGQGELFPLPRRDSVRSITSAWGESWLAMPLPKGFHAKVGTATTSNKASRRATGQVEEYELMPRKDEYDFSCATRSDRCRTRPRRSDCRYRHAMPY